MWDFRSITPMQRPEELADKDFLTEEEAANLEQEAVDRDIRLWERQRSVRWNPLSGRGLGRHRMLRRCPGLGVNPWGIRPGMSEYKGRGAPFALRPQAFGVLYLGRGTARRPELVPPPLEDAPPLV